MEKLIIRVLLNAYGDKFILMKPRENLMLVKIIRRELLYHLSWNLFIRFTPMLSVGKTTI